ncbi:hypothetical protein H5407_16400 [Mitsuaria sp. WAJ17]|uniref:hypothetical protein n=1 Tax=Mitsuaria sp. WAJ17 TaxID=2761452 RepID=UPI0016001970|nr:hypothetical protein [Mitsuaria sp. WAJ17]MBB2486809.1 hypothetical protein [Mitsuaria sp. WAJ17]
MIIIHRRIGVLAAAAALALLSACTTPAPVYTASVENAESLKKLAATSVGEFQLAMSGSGATSISLRADNMVSPVGGNYAAYLAEALRAELSLAGKLDPKSPFEITGSLLKNDIAAGGFSTNSGEIEARFVLKRDGQERYSAVKRAQAQWESSFVGAVAIPKARNQYPLLVQQVLKELLTDPEFVKALR